MSNTSERTVDWRKRSDQEWITLLKKGDDGAYRDLTEFLRKRLRLRYKESLLSSIDSMDDIIQESLIRISELIHKGKFGIKERDSFLAYCAMVVNSKYIDMVRRERRTFDRTDYGVPESIPAPDERPNPKKIMAELTPFLEQLKSRDRQVIEQMYFMNTPHNVVAEYLNISENALYVIRHRALRRLQESIIQAGYKMEDFFDV